MPPKGTKPASDVIERAKKGISKVDFVDVQQGDGAVTETPTATVMLIDGGNNQMFARYLASTFRRRLTGGGRHPHRRQIARG